MTFCIIDNMIATTIDVTNPSMDPFLDQLAVAEFAPDHLPANVMQLLGIYKGEQKEAFKILF